MSRSGRRSRGIRRLLWTAALLIAAAAYLRWGDTALQRTDWDVSFPDLPTGFDGWRVVVVSDLHGAEFGEGNRDLFRMVEGAAPEAVFFLGDLEDGYRGPREGYAEQIADGLTVAAPTYYVTGNHEWWIGGVRELERRLRDHGVTVLSNDYEYLERGGDVILLAGIEDPNGPRDQKTPEALAEEIRTARPDYFWILLAHRNDQFPKRYCRLGADLVLSGHGHGGLVRLPFTDGLVSTDRTLFPSWTWGFYEKDGARLFVTRGLGDSGSTFRIFDRPEVAVLTFHRGEGP